MKGPNLLLLHLLLCTASIQASKLNVPRVLLPFTSSPPPFTLVAESGCYKWTSNRPDIAKVCVDIYQESIIDEWSETVH